jgi:hypothetical protein
MRPNKFILGLAVAFAVVLDTHATDFLQQANSALFYRDPQNRFQLQLSGLVDLETYFLEQPAPGLIYTPTHFLFNPRLTIFLDASVGSHFYLFIQARTDRGFDPSNEPLEARADEYFLRYTPLNNSRINLQVGKFATVVGNWVQRHDSWQNPFINAPLPYEHLTGIWDSGAPGGVDDLLVWGRVPTDEYGSKFGDGYGSKEMRLPIIWGPSYATGLSISGKIDKFEYAAEMKNAALASRPGDWDLTEQNFNNPTFSGRFGFQPDPMWNFGMSASGGAYLDSVAEPTLSAGREIGDYRELVLGQDVSFAWHHLQLWAEAFETRFEVPRIGNADVIAYYVEAKYKITPQLFGALRWNQQLYSTLRDEDERVQWGGDTWRVDAAVGYRFTDYLQSKVQYSYTGTEFEKGNNLFAVQLTVKF